MKVATAVGRDKVGRGLERKDTIGEIHAVAAGVAAAGE
jgi:hypothetical protein